MKVLEYTGVRQAQLSESPEPKASGKISVARTIATQVSAGTEMSFYRGDHPFFQMDADENGLWTSGKAAFRFPLKANDPGVWGLGYAAVGRIVEVGPDETTLKKGDLVFSGPGDAGHQEYVASAGFIKLPEDANPYHATLHTLIGVATLALWDSTVRLMDEVVVIGMGTVGHLVLQMCKLSGARVIAVDRIASRLELAQCLGADVIFNPQTDGDLGIFVRQQTKGRGADTVFEVSGNPEALDDAIRCASFDGQVTVTSFYPRAASNLVLGKEFHHNRIRLRSSQAGGINPALGPAYTRERLAETGIGLLSRLNLEPLISHRVPFAELPSALAMIDQNPAECLTVIVTYE